MTSCRGVYILWNEHLKIYYITFCFHWNLESLLIFIFWYMLACLEAIRQIFVGIKIVTIFKDSFIFIWFAYSWLVNPGMCVISWVFFFIIWDFYLSYQNSLLLYIFYNIFSKEENRILFVIKCPCLLDQKEFRIPGQFLNQGHCKSKYIWLKNLLTTIDINLKIIKLNLKAII